MSEHRPGPLGMALLEWIQAHRIVRYDDGSVLSHNEGVNELLDIIEEFPTACTCNLGEEASWPCACGKQHNVYSFSHRFSKKGVHWRGGHWRMRCVLEEQGHE